MNWHKGIKDLLDDNSSVTALVSTRIFPLVAPAATITPYITYEVVGATVHNTKENPAAHLSSVEIVGYCDTYAEAAALGTQMINAMKHKSWTSGALSIDKTFIKDQNIERLNDPTRYAFVLEVNCFVPYKN